MSTMTVRCAFEPWRQWFPSNVRAELKDKIHFSILTKGVNNLNKISLNVSFGIKRKYIDLKISTIAEFFYFQRSDHYYYSLEIVSISRTRNRSAKGTAMPAEKGSTLLLSFNTMINRFTSTVTVFLLISTALQLKTNIIIWMYSLIKLFTFRMQSHRAW